MVPVEQSGGWRRFLVALLYAFLSPGEPHPLSTTSTLLAGGRNYLHGCNPHPAAIRGGIARRDWFVYPAALAALVAPLGGLPALIEPETKKERRAGALRSYPTLYRASTVLRLSPVNFRRSSWSMQATAKSGTSCGFVQRPGGRMLAASTKPG